jgi:sugar lactone lactonase YvrE
VKALWRTILGGIGLPALLCAPVLAGGLDAKFLRASDDSFSRPHDLVLSPDRRFLYVADVGNNVVKVLDPDTLKTVGAIGRGDLDSPHDVTFDREGRLLVADSGNDRIVVFRVDGAKGTRVAIHGKHQASPEGVAVSDDGRIYVTNAGSNTVLMLMAGALRKTAVGDAKHRFARPHDIHIDSRGRVLVADPGNHRIQILDRDLNRSGVLGGPPYGFNEPKYLASDAEGRGQPGRPNWHRRTRQGAEPVQPARRGDGLARADLDFRYLQRPHRAVPADRLKRFRMPPAHASDIRIIQPNPKNKARAAITVRISVVCFTRERRKPNRPLTVSLSILHLPCIIKRPTWQFAGTPRAHQ